MSKCPYCKNEVKLTDFFGRTKGLSMSGKTKVDYKSLKAESVKDSTLGWYAKMWACPSCDTILGFTESF